MLFTSFLSQDLFLSTLSLRRATQHGADAIHDAGISIHALLAESDWWSSSDRCRRSHFYPRSPCGERPRGRQPALSQSSISIHALLAESDRKSAQNSGALLRI